MLIILDKIVIYVVLVLPSTYNILLTLTGEQRMYQMWSKLWKIFLSYVSTL